jgi:hypothetical protein
MSGLSFQNSLMKHRNSVSSPNRSDLTFSRVGLLPDGWAFGISILSSDRRAALLLHSNATALGQLTNLVGDAAK